MITCSQELEESIEQMSSNKFSNICKQICKDFGINPAFLDKREWYTVVFPEQTGLRLRPTYKARIELSYTLKDKLPQLSSRSGIYTLKNDCFTVKWSKNEHNIIPVSNKCNLPALFSHKEAWKFRGSPYSSVRVPEESLKWIGDCVDKIVHVSKEKLRRVLEKEDISASKWYVAWDALRLKLEDAISLQDIRRLADKLTRDNLDRDGLKNDFFTIASWEEWNYFDYFNNANRTIFNRELFNIDAIFNDMIIAIDDFQTLWEKLCNIYGREIVSICGIILDDTSSGRQKIESVMFDKNTKRLFINNQSKTDISSDTLKKLAEQWATTWPTALIEYLMLIMSWYIMIDDWKEVGFDVRAKDIFMSYNNELIYPVISLKERIISCFRAADKQEKLEDCFWDDLLSFYNQSVNTELDKLIESF